MLSRFPVLPMVAAAYRDVLSDVPGFLRSITLILGLLIVVVELPSLLIFNHIQTNITPELSAVKDRLQKAVAEGATSLNMKDQARLDELTSQLLAPTIGMLVTNLLWFVLFFRFIYEWYRRLLTGEDKGKLIGFRIARPEWQLIWTATKVAFVLFPFSIIAFGLIISVQPPSGMPPSATWGEILPWLVVCGIGLLYLQARMTVAYPATVIEDPHPPVRQSWNLTKWQSLNLIAGNLLTALPVFLGGVALFMGLAFLLQLVIPMPEGGPQPGDLGILFAQFVGKAFVSAWSLLLFGLLSAFHAHAYAYLVRSSSSVSVH
jgi:hypothetical protein